MEFIFKKGSGFKLKIGRTAFFTLLATIEIMQTESVLRRGAEMVSETVIYVTLFGLGGN